MSDVLDILSLTEGFLKVAIIIVNSQMHMNILAQILSSKV